MLKLALLGCSDVAVQTARVASRLQNARFVAAVDSDPEKAQRTADALVAPISTSSLDQLLNQHPNAFDALLLLSPVDMHETQCTVAAQAGKHVMVESPIAPTIAAADAMIAACRQEDVRLMVGQSSRFLPSVQTVKTNLDSGKLGDLGLLRMHRWESFDGDTALMERIIGEIDLAIWLSGDLPSEIYAVGRNDYLQIHLGFPSGAMALVDYAGHLPSGDDYFSLSAIAATGAAYADDHRNMQLLYRGGNPAALKTTQGDLHILTQLQEFVAAIAEHREPSITGADGRAAVEVAAAVLESASHGRAVHNKGATYELV